MEDENCVFFTIMVAVFWVIGYLGGLSTYQANKEVCVPTTYLVYRDFDIETLKKSVKENANYPTSSGYGCAEYEYKKDCNFEKCSEDEKIRFCGHACPVEYRISLPSCLCIGIK